MSNGKKKAPPKKNPPSNVIKGGKKKSQPKASDTFKGSGKKGHAMYHRMKKTAKGVKSKAKSAFSAISEHMSSKFPGMGG